MTFEEESAADEEEVFECSGRMARVGNLCVNTYEGFCQLQPRHHASVHICQYTSACLESTSPARL